MELWQIILTATGAICFVAGGTATFVVAIRTKSDEGWRKIAERRKADNDDLTQRLAERTQRLKDAERDRDDFTQRYLRAVAKVEWYEARHGPLPADIHTTRDEDTTRRR